MNDFFKKENKINEQVILSDSGKYKLCIESYKTREGCWNYSKGIISDFEGNLISEVERNYQVFPYLFIEDHFNGHDYLVCGKDYQGQTLIELDTKRRIDHIPEEAKSGQAWCWIQAFVSPLKDVLAVEGCYWGAPSDVVFVDFRKPMTFPKYIEVAEREDIICDRFFKWEDDYLARVGCILDIRKSDGKRLWDLNDYEINKAIKNNDLSEKEETILWTISDLNKTTKL